MIIYMKTLKLSFTPALGAALGAVLLIAPVATSADATTARLGGGNALLRATTGQSQGLARSNPASDIFAHLTFAGTRGGQPETTPNENSNTGGGTSSEQSDGENGADSTSAGGAGGNGGNNGGATAGNGGSGGNGGNAAPAGLVRAGDSVSNSTALNVININIIRISSR